MLISQQSDNFEQSVCFFGQGGFRSVEGGSPGWALGSGHGGGPG